MILVDEDTQQQVWDFICPCVRAFKPSPYSPPEEALVRHPHYDHCYLPFAKHQASVRDLLFWCGAFFGDEGRKFAQAIPALNLH
jgi:hypothetical protein